MGTNKAALRLLCHLSLASRYGGTPEAPASFHFRFNHVSGRTSRRAVVRLSRRGRQSDLPARHAGDAVDERNFRIKYAELLNPAQLAAVTHRDGPMLVVAGAGSGKTRTLIYRVARLIESGVPPGAILLLTFTRRAAQEMLRRVEHLVGDRTARWPAVPFTPSPT